VIDSGTMASAAHRRGLASTATVWELIEGFPEWEHKRLLEQFDSIGQRLDSLVKATSNVHEDLSLDIVLIRLMTLITDSFDADRSTLFLYDAESHELHSRIA
jgi:hypothetical protein